MGENCSSGCRTRDHATYGECLREKSLRPMFLGGTERSWTDEKRFRRTNEAYRQAVKDGLQPAGVRMDAINQAYEDAAKG